jgi:hypothetical protein
MGSALLMGAGMGLKLGDDEDDDEEEDLFGNEDAEKKND